MQHNLLVGIIDYRMGNLTSVRNALSALKIPCRILSVPDQLSSCSHYILPGVGAFSEAMNALKSEGWIEPLQRYVLQKERPILGICLGMQLLATTSQEFGIHQGLNWIPGKVSRIQPDVPSLHIPHVGWNDVQQKNEGKLYEGIPNNSDFYFVHSYHLVPRNPLNITGTTDYGMEVTASMESDRIFAVQFHPEKGGPIGLRLLKNFSEI